MVVFLHENCSSQFGKMPFGGAIVEKQEQFKFYFDLLSPGSQDQILILLQYLVLEAWRESHPEQYPVFQEGVAPLT